MRSRQRAGDRSAAVGVLFVESGETGGGSAESLYQHLRVIDRRLYRPVVVYLNDIRYVELVRQLGFPVHVLRDRIYSRHAVPTVRRMMLRARSASLRFGPLGAYEWFARIAHRSTVRALCQIIHDAQIRILHLNVQVARDLFGLFAAEQSGVICISHLRSANPKMPRSLFDSDLARYANRVVSAFIANTGTTEKFWLERGVDRKKTWRVYNGVPTQPVSPLNLAEIDPAIRDAGCVLGCVASLRDELKVDAFLLTAFKRFLTRRPDAVLVIVGDGPMKDVLRRLAVELNIDSRVVFVGFHPESSRILAALDASLVITSHDSFGRVALESLRSKTPLVATDAGAIRELIQDGTNGILVRYGDEEGLASALELVVSDGLRRSRIVENGYRTVCEQFSIERYAGRIHEIYQTQLEAGQRA